MKRENGRFVSWIKCNLRERCCTKMVDVQVWLATIYYNNWRTEETVTVFHLNVSKRDGEGGRSGGGTIARRWLSCCYYYIAYETCFTIQPDHRRNRWRRDRSRCGTEDRSAKWDPTWRRSASERRPPRRARALCGANWRKSRISPESNAPALASLQWCRPKSLWRPVYLFSTK